MGKTQVQIPDELFRRAKQLAAEKEWSFAELVRRGLEEMTKLNPAGRTVGRDWCLPKARSLGEPLIPETEWSAACHD